MITTKLAEFRIMEYAASVATLDSRCGLYPVLPEPRSLHTQRLNHTILCGELFTRAWTHSRTKHTDENAHSDGDAYAYPLRSARARMCEAQCLSTRELLWLLLAVDWPSPATLLPSSPTQLLVSHHPPHPPQRVATQPRRRGSRSAYPRASARAQCEEHSV